VLTAQLEGWDFSTVLKQFWLNDLLVSWLNINACENTIILMTWTIYSPPTPNQQVVKWEQKHLINTQTTTNSKKVILNETTLWLTEILLTHFNKSPSIQSQFLIIQRDFMHNVNFRVSLSTTKVTWANFSQNTFPISVTLFAMSSTGFREHLLENKTSE